MFAGKTSYIYTKYRQYSKQEGVRILTVKPKMDTRSSEVTTHTGFSIPCVCVSELTGMDVSEVDVLLVDEAQWFPDLLDFVKLHWKTNLRMYIAGLCGDIHQEKFGQISDILQYCSEFFFVHDICSVCGEASCFNKRKGDEESRDVPGGAELYFTVCSKHLCLQRK